MKKSFILFLLFSLALFPSTLFAERPYWEEMHFCKSDSDCVEAPLVHTGCFRYCKAKECDSAKDCPLMNKLFKNFPDCAVNVACKSNPSGIICKNSQCARKE